ncbi:hypothetical protein B0J11DRAFT_141582 [Dendryphion nanum]|uniref:Rhodopsin domain-containing protein n=1 Tax=Dendryphion nanum TaxID=256645 RepID=A0A9P9IA73_9PLEO|nr:hypothetical protein B0J11DRAFT_141582 [Dendryphion nanum]
MSSSSSIIPLAVESWILYAIAICVVGSRLIFRLITLGSFRNLQFDDWLMIFVLIPFTATTVAANQVNLHWDSTDPSSRVLALKMKFFLEEMQMTTTWLVKACLLILYRRIFPDITNRNLRRLMTGISVFWLVTYILNQILLPVWCHPISGYWSLTPHNGQSFPSRISPTIENKTDQHTAKCATYAPHAITTLTTSLTTTLAILIFPIPFIPTPRKLLLALLLLLGTLVLITSILSRTTLLTSPTKSTYLYWHTAEAALTIYFANLPFLSSLLTSTTAPRIRHLNSTLSLSPWPRSRLNSIVTTEIREPAYVPRPRLNSSVTIATTANEDCWSDESKAGSTPPTPSYQTLRSTDPPLELEGYWKSRRPETRGTDVDVEKLFADPNWPLRS